MRNFRTLSCLFVLLALTAAAFAEPRVLIVSVDGLRPDLALLADCPTLRGLMARGSYTMWARTTPSGKTLPSHVTMLTGRSVEAHGIHWNSTAPPDGVDYTQPHVPTLFELAKQAGLTTAMVAGKSKFVALNREGSLDHVFISEDTGNDDDTTGAAVRTIAEAAPRVMFFHLPDTDSTGHGKGWGSPQQMRTIEHADRCIARVLDALEAEGVLDQTLVIVTADHGGWVKNHNGSDVRGRTIPWIAAGPGVVAGQDLTLVPDLQVDTEDTFATACAFLGLELPADCEGVPVEAIFPDGAASAEGTAR